MNEEINEYIVSRLEQDYLEIYNKLIEDYKSS